MLAQLLELACVEQEETYAPTHWTAVPHLSDSQLLCQHAHEHHRGMATQQVAQSSPKCHRGYCQVWKHAHHHLTDWTMRHPHLRGGSCAWAGRCVRRGGRREALSGGGTSGDAAPPRPSTPAGDASPDMTPAQWIANVSDALQMFGREPCWRAAWTAHVQPWDQFEGM